ncbi:MAG TPA: lysophospholipid acyltransferase family protein [Chitinophagaceae bacterium]|nr:1-acyl-sn-glycerol-3-phosphate acyltransferase [Chitinophagaceae bacterium]HNF29376.1 lysophospholipid acyltransferase family protein [Chitinophagaceae bacterium]HNJ58587.1 lysophospholipid acyltransferase family protein [Chitinophagaceae bacterium]HNL82301.1 lysophospholipid acyltransferase family protein [Chitinophagaceae bacterium]
MKQLLEFFKNVFARIWALWGLVTFVVTFFIFFIPSMCTHLIADVNKSQNVFIYIAKIWMNVWLFLVGCRVKVRGKENVEKNKTYIFTCNHNTLLDVPITCPYIPGGNKTIAKKSFVKIPIFGWYYAKGGILIDRKSDASRRMGFEQMKKTLQQKIHVCIYPEGTRNRTGKPLKSFYDGAFKLAELAQTPIVPTMLYNTLKAMPNNKFFYLLPHSLEIHFLPAISPQNLTMKELKDKVFDIMYKEFELNNKKKTVSIFYLLKQLTSIFIIT